MSDILIRFNIQNQTQICGYPLTVRFYSSKFLPKDINCERLSESILSCINGYEVTITDRVFITLTMDPMREQEVMQQFSLRRNQGHEKFFSEIRIDVCKIANEPLSRFPSTSTYVVLISRVHVVEAAGGSTLLWV